MFRSFAAVAAAIGFVGLVAAGAPAQAALDTPGNLTVGGFKYTWFGTVDGFCTTTPLCANAQIVANVTNTGIEIRPVTGVTIVSGPGGDLAVQIQIESLSGAPINSYSVSTHGTGTASTGVNLYAQDFFTGLGSATAAAGATSSVALATSPPRTTIFASVDSTNGTGVVNYVGITVTTVPEPATLAIFATGIAGLIRLRRRAAA